MRLPTIRVYYLDRQLSPDEVQIVTEDLEAVVEQVRLPHVLPAPVREAGYSDRPLADVETVAPLLATAGIASDPGEQVALVVPKDQHWYLALSEAIYRETGFHPYLIQTAEQREHTGNPGELRVLDAHGLMGLK